MRLRKILWIIILLKFFLFYGVLKFFVFDENLKTLYPDDKSKSQFVFQNLTKE